MPMRAFERRAAHSKALEEAAEDGTLLRVGTDVKVVREADLN